MATPQILGRRGMHARWTLIIPQMAGDCFGEPVMGRVVEKRTMKMKQWGSGDDGTTGLVWGWPRSGRYLNRLSKLLFLLARYENACKVAPVSLAKAGPNSHR